MPISTINNDGLAAQAQYTGFKNRVINGSAQVDQRNYGVAQIGVSSGAYIADRFSFATSQNGKWNLQQLPVSDLLGFTSSLYATIGTTYTTGAADYTIIDHKIEGLNVADLGWGTVNAQTVTLSFRVKTNVAGTYGVTVLNSAANRGYCTTYTVASSGVWTTVSITIPGDTSGTWLTNNGIGIWLRFSLGCGSNYAFPTPNTWGSSFGYQPSGGAVISGNAGGYWQATGIQLEVGSTATSFDVRDYGRELIMCYRYYQKHLYFKMNGPAASSGAAANRLGGTLLATMRVSPTINIIGDVSVFNGSTATYFNTIAASYSSPTTLEMDTGSLAATVTGLSPITTFVAGTWYATASAEL